MDNMAILRFGLPAQEVLVIAQGRVKTTFYVKYTLATLSDFDNLKKIQKKVRANGGTMEPKPTPKNPCRNASIDWYFPAGESTSSENE